MKNIGLFFLLFSPIYSFCQFLEIDPSKGSKELEISNDKSIQLKLNSTDAWLGGGMRLNVNDIEQGAIKTGFFLTPGLSISAAGQRNIYFSTNNNVRMFINPTGNIGVGTITPNANYLLDINGAFQATNATINGTLDVNGPIEANRLKLFGISGSGTRGLYVQNNGDVSAEKREFFKGVYFSDFTATRDHMILFPSSNYMGLYGSSFAMADLDLPDGAEILEYSFVFMDNSSSRNIKMELEVADWTSNNSTTYPADSRGLANSGAWRTVTRNFTTPVVVDNNSHMYILKMTCIDNNGADQNMPIESLAKFRGIKIKYRF